jgi:hypothetical protein
MSETTQLGLPLLQPSQAQKHVTVNEALAKLDGLTQLVLTSATVSEPPSDAPDGAAFFLPPQPVNAWEGQGGRVAVAANGGWVFATPKLGWRGYIEDEATTAIFNGVDWVRGGLNVSASGAASALQVVEFDHEIEGGAVSTTLPVIPQYACVFALTGRVKTEITGSLTGFELGVAGAGDRYGSGIGLAQGSWFVGATGHPLTYYTDTAIEIRALGGDFEAGALRIALHFYLPSVPRI